MIIGTNISQCRKYRYTLERDLGLLGEGVLLFMMLNPSTADEFHNDPTLKRSIGFGQKWGYRTLLVGNLYAFRSSKPADLWEAEDPVGPENWPWLVKLFEVADTIVCAWGQKGPRESYADVMDDFIRNHRAAIKRSAPTFLTMNANGCPGHPLYLKGDLMPQRWQ
jgi:hypothetical protein